MIVVPEKPRWSADEKERKKYKKDLAEFKKYLQDALLLDENSFDEFFSLSTTEHYIMFNFRGWGFDRDKYSRGVIKRFKTGKYGFLSFEEIEDITQELQRMKLESEREAKEEAIREKAERILSKLLKKYEKDYSDRGKNGGFSIEFNGWRVDYPNSIFIEYNPINDLGIDDDDFNKEFLLTGYYKDTKKEFNDVIPQAITIPDDIQEVSFLDAIRSSGEKFLQGQVERGVDTSYNFVITSFKLQYKRFTEAVNMYILIDGTLTTPEFQLPDALTKTLDRILKTSDKCIEWQIEITDFAENLKKEINPKYFELAKEM